MPFGRGRDHHVGVQSYHFGGGDGGGRESDGGVGGGRGDDRMTTTMDMTTTVESDGGGCPRKFHSTARFDRVMGDAAYDQRHRNRARG